MVSVNSAAFLALGLASLSNAAAISHQFSSSETVEKKVSESEKPTSFSTISLKDSTHPSVLKTSSVSVSEKPSTEALTTGYSSKEWATVSASEKPITEKLSTELSSEKWSEKTSSVKPSSEKWATVSASEKTASEKTTSEKTTSEKWATVSASDKTEKTASAPITSYAAATASEPRPWYLDEFSKTFVHDAVAIRSKNVSETEASAVAKHLVDAGLDHPQYTALASEAMQMWVDNGFQPNATALYAFATNAKSAQDEIHQSLPYWEYVDYVQTTAATVFDVSLLEPTGAKHLNGSAASRASRHRAAVTSCLSSLYADPSGSAALKTLDEVYSQYEKDFEGSGSPAVKMTSGLVENVLQNLFNVI